MNTMFKGYGFLLGESYMINKLKNRVRFYIDLGVSYKRYAVLNGRVKDGVNVLSVCLSCLRTLLQFFFVVFSKTQQKILLKKLH